MNQRAELEELLQDLLRAQSHLGSAESSTRVAASTAERGPLMGTFIRPVQSAAATLSGLWWQLEGHISVVRAELAKLPAPERSVYSGRHA
jgi:hypothetical protein